MSEVKEYIKRTTKRKRYDGVVGHDVGVMSTYNCEVAPDGRHCWHEVSQQDNTKLPKPHGKWAAAGHPPEFRCLERCCWCGDEIVEFGAHGGVVC